MELNNFLVEAKVNTYASNGESGETKLADGSKEFRFEKEGFKYRDRYFGSRTFIGEEIVFQNEEPIWSMNYYGGVVSGVESSSAYEFLKEALQKVSLEKPFRGPDNFKKNDWEYMNRPEGSIEKFIGEETISFKGKVIYKLNYRGGVIK